jgi:hypothetical protein
MHRTEAACHLDPAGTFGPLVYGSGHQHADPLNFSAQCSLRSRLSNCPGV